MPQDIHGDRMTRYLAALILLATTSCRHVRIESPQAPRLELADAGDRPVLAERRARQYSVLSGLLPITRPSPADFLPADCKAVRVETRSTSMDYLTSLAGSALLFFVWTGATGGLEKIGEHPGLYFGGLAVGQALVAPSSRTIVGQCLERSAAPSK